jgi:hypothetical protein
VTTQALYNHIGGRRELLTLLANDYIELFQLGEELADAPWRPWLTAFARSLRAHLRAHPGLAASVVTQGPNSPQAVEFVERTVEKMVAGGFSAASALRSYRVVVEFVVGWAQHHDGLPPSDRPPRPDLSPPLRSSPIGEDIMGAWTDDDEELFAFGLDALIEGLEQAGGAPRTRRAPRARPAG